MEHCTPYAEVTLKKHGCHTLVQIYSHTKPDRYYQASVLRLNKIKNEVYVSLVFYDPCKKCQLTIFEEN